MSRLPRGNLTLKYKKIVTQDQTHIIVGDLKLPKQRKECYPFLVHTVVHPRAASHIKRGHLNYMLCFILAASEQT